MFSTVLVLSLLLSLANAFFNIIIKWILHLCFPKVSLSSRAEISEIEKQMNALSKVANFAQYIRLERQKNKILEGQKLEAQKRVRTLERRLRFCGYIIQAVLTIMSVVLFWREHGRPVVVLPSDWLNPFSNIFSWPTAVSGGISYPIWFLITNTVSKIMAKPFV